ncbi:sodium- and chloride-dependent neutral and basic amino acid transporter B(0+)-like [Ylistrum balloti]|uniref:sodium- and chloride-dependent neutral and basic amino acid transporter B(0+)-like n=1 Tax=Ylistrum balloti TaxID=509963 RepID=UPI002905802E|nr:sodium- and chloride-dependent neutral and basic amino acid transporter B(0+)-like [Ylistrum balloti]
MKNSAYEMNEKNGTDGGSNYYNGSQVTESSGDLTGSGEPEEDRGEWGSKWEFILSCIGLSVGLGNVWRFPYLAYDNGGAAFVIAYLVLQFLIGKPMYFMELVMGQYSGKGPTAVWNMNPCAKGIGISMALISLVVAIYYNVIMAYTLFYFFSSMQKTLPWTVCKPEWLPEGCVEQTVKKMAYCVSNVTVNEALGVCRCTGNSTFDTSLYDAGFNCTNATYQGDSPIPVAQFFFDRDVLDKTPTLSNDNIGAPLWKLALCLLMSWIIVVLCLIKGVKSSGKVVYFTATFPYVILLILLVRGATLDGAIDGVIYFIVPKWEKLLDVNVWVAAAGQMFFSLSVSFGGIIMFGSYNKFSNNVYGDAMLIAVMDIVTSIIAGFVIFTTFGGMAKEIGVGVEDVAKSGYGLAFVAYPEALSNLPPSQLWSVLFFFMLFTLGLDSEFALLETVLTCIQDEFPHLRKYKSQMCVGLGIALYFLALPCVTPAGDYIVGLMDHYGADFSVLFVASCECVAVMWVYGAKRFMKNVEYMLGYPPRPTWYWLFCWIGCSPILIAALFIYRMVQYKPIEISDGVPYPQYAQSIGWALTSFVMCPIPIYFVYKFLRTEGSFVKKLRKITTPTDAWGPNDGSDKVKMYEPEPARKYGVDNPISTHM